MTKKNDCSQRKDDTVAYLCRIACSKTVDSMEEAITSFQKSEFWADGAYSKLKDYVSKYWFSIKEVNHISVNNFLGRNLQISYI